jgi:hypothetical protein
MNWRLERACSLIIRSYDKPKSIGVKVSLIADMLDRICIGLCLLQEGLIESLDLVDLNNKDLFRLQRAVHGTSLQIESFKIILGLEARSLKILQHYTIRTVRDRVAEVDHLDVEAELLGQPDQTVNVMIAYPDSIPPFSPEEMRRRLGL